MHVSLAERGRLRERADRFLFGEADGLSAALFRIGLALMIALVFRGGGSAVFLLASHERMPSARAIYDALFLRAPYWWVILALLAALALGWRARLVSFALVVLLVPLVFREGRVQGRLALFLALLAFSFLRSDARLSLRSLAGGAMPEGPGPLWPIRLIQVVLTVLYGVNALAKSTPAYLHGDVILGQSLMLPNYRVDLSDGALDVGPLAIPLWAGAMATVFTEYSLALGFWFRRLRVPVALLGVGFHAALTFVIQIGYLNLVSVFLYSAFLLPFDRHARAPQPNSHRGIA